MTSPALCPHLLSPPPQPGWAPCGPGAGPGPPPAPPARPPPSRLSDLTRMSFWEHLSARPTAEATLPCPTWSPFCVSSTRPGTSAPEGEGLWANDKCPPQCGSRSVRKIIIKEPQAVGEGELPGAGWGTVVAELNTFPSHRPSGAHTSLQHHPSAPLGVAWMEEQQFVRQTHMEQGGMWPRSPGCRVEDGLRG